MQSIDAKLALTNLRLYVADMLRVVAAATRMGESPRWLTEQHNVAGGLQGKQQAQTLPRYIHMVPSKVCIAAWAGRVREHIPTASALHSYLLLLLGRIHKALEPLRGRFYGITYQMHLNASNVAAKACDY